MAAVLVLVNNVKVRYGNTIAVAVFALTVYKVIQAIYVLTIHSQQKVEAEVKVCIVTNVVVTKDAVCPVYGKAETAALAAQMQKKVWHGFMNMVIWHSAYSRTEHDATLITVLDQR